MFCQSCGSKVNEADKFCENCGAMIEGISGTERKKMIQQNGRMQYGNVQDAPSVGFAVLGFFLTSVGLTLYLVWREILPLRAKSVGKGTLIGLIVPIVLVIICLLLI